MTRSRLAAARRTALAIIVAGSAASMAAAQGGAHMADVGGALGASPAASGGAGATGVLRVCADPNNLPFSDRAGRGFENRIAELLARTLHERVEYTWWAQRRGFVRSTLNARRCDVVIGIVAGDPQVMTSRPYYRSTYVFVSRAPSARPVASFDDPRLRTMRIGLHVIGADYNSLPPGVALARRGLVHNVVGYSIYGNYADESPPSRLISAVADGDVDVAVAWGPLAGFYAARSRIPLVLTPVASPGAAAGIPFRYDIAVGVRRDDRARLRRLQSALDRDRAAIRRTLREYAVPLAPGASAGAVAVSAHPGAPRRCAPADKERTCT